MSTDLIQVQNLCKTYGDDEIIISENSPAIIEIPIIFVDSLDTAISIDNTGTTILGNLVDDIKLFKVEYSADSITNLDDIDEIEDWYVELYYSTDPDLSGDTNEDNIINDSSSDSDSASDSNPEAESIKYELGYRGKSFTPIINLPNNFPSINKYSAVLIIKWKRNEVQEIINFANYLLFNNFILENFRLKEDILSFFFANKNFKNKFSILKRKFPETVIDEDLYSPYNTNSPEKMVSKLTEFSK
jgi:hypothetical protein